jgi:hypothetical protein
MTLEAKLRDEISHFANKNRVYLKGCKRLTYYSTCLFMRYLVLHMNFIGSALNSSVPHATDPPVKCMTVLLHSHPSAFVLLPHDVAPIQQNPSFDF